jgi:hypothetical protein
MRAILLGGVAVALVAACAGSGSHPTSGASATPVASGVRAQPGSPAPSGQAGAISGSLSYPSEFLPGQAVYALSVDGMSYYKVESVSYQGRYTIKGVPAGDYYVYSVARWGSPQQRFGAGYTKAIACGLSVDCTDHSPLTVHVDAGSTTTGVNILDWYPGPDAFPLIPDGPTSIPSPEPSTFESAESAARSLGEARLIGRDVPNQAGCGANSACFWFVSSTNGHDASYFIAYAGSNQDLIRCGLYVVRDGGRWRPLDVRCGPAEAGAFPGIHEAGRVALVMGQTGCVHVRKSPGLTAPILQCLGEGTKVVIDGGPYYLPSQASTGANGPAVVDLWWHVAGRGWMSHEYLYAG